MQTIVDKIKKRLGSVPKYIWILLAIVLVGIFLRTYHFHDWLTYDADQVRDAVLIKNVVEGKETWPAFGPTMRKSEDALGMLFHVGPIYYDMQIVAAKIFGNVPDHLAYPDLLFSILAIPLFFFFLKRYFSVNLSLSLTGVFAISFFAIQYSRFAWNPNMIPFFTILFLLSLHEFLVQKEKTAWTWAVLAGLSIGIGIQLHIILFVLFPATAFFVFAYLLQNSWQIYKKLLLILLVAIILNLGQLSSELKTGFANTRILFASTTLNDSTKKGNLSSELGNNLDCHIEANAYMLSSAGLDTCDFTYTKLLDAKKIKQYHKELKSFAFKFDLVLVLLFSIFGYGALVYHAWKETEDTKKYFLWLVLLYAALSFLIMVPASDSSFNSLRYFIHVFFVPYIFLGFLVNFLLKKIHGRYKAAAYLVFLPLIITNLSSVRSVARDLSNNNKSDIHFAILGEMEFMTQYLINGAGTQKNIYLVGDQMYAVHFFKQFDYLAQEQGYDVSRVTDNSQKVPAGAPVFAVAEYVPNKLKKAGETISGYRIESWKIFGKVVIYKLQN